MIIVKNHSHKKRKYRLEKRALLLMFLKLEISGVAVQRIRQNSEYWWFL